MTIDEAFPMPVPAEAPDHADPEASFEPLVEAAVPATCHVPDLIGLDAPEAHMLARAAGVRLSVSVWETRVGPWGMVLEQRPGPRARVRRGTRVQVVVSGRPQAHIPDVVGLDLRTALERLSWLGFVPLVAGRQRSLSVPVGHIISTRPSAGTLVAEGSVVALTVARSARSDHD
jgi:eukaryotic-like serine/threonine-protein kinase